jgi:hypothetical protein
MTDSIQHTFVRTGAYRIRVLEPPRGGQGEIQEYIRHFATRREAIAFALGVIASQWPQAEAPSEVATYEVQALYMQEAE